MLLSLTPVAASAVITNVDEADDLCSPTADPCSITDKVEVVSGAVLDFGTRAVVITGAGEIDAGDGDVTLRCGRLTINTSGSAITLKGPDGFGTTSGGFGVFEVRRRCSGNTSILCTRDSTCSVGGVGTCSVGDGDVLLDGKVVTSADSPGSFILRAAGDIDVQSTVTANGTGLESDAGLIELSASGSLNIAAKLQASSGPLGTGGELCLSAGGDMTITEPLDATGGDFDGGILDIAADGNLVLTNDINVNATSGEGFGGEILMDVDGDIEIVGGGSANKLILKSDGHQSSEAYGGDGGTQDYFAGGDITIGKFVKASADGAPPDGFGDSITVDASGDILFEGELQAKSQGLQGGGGDVAVSASGTVVITDDAVFDVTGGDSGGGNVEVFGHGVTYDGLVVATGGAGGRGGTAELDSIGLMSIGGDIDINGGNTGASQISIQIFGCYITVDGSAKLDNKLPEGVNEIVVREQLTLAGGSKLLAGSLGTNRILYRTNQRPPIIGGTVDPAPLLVLQPTLSVCPICGNSEVELGETCDDGGTIPGDGCSADCQDEGCIADTPGYPVVALCDDGNQCTVDSCNMFTSSCDHVSTCDDGIDCTVDSCGGGSCTHTPDDGACDDGDDCSQDMCSPATGCVAVPVAGPCDDGLFCNGADTCSGGVCSVHAGNPCQAQTECDSFCNEAFQLCGAPFGTPCTGDGNVCTDNVCDGGGSCIAIINASPCDDGIFCNGNDVCENGACAFHVGSPCLLAGECADFCDEGAGACQSPALEPCGDDGNVCTDDYCDGAGGCSHVANVASCDDGDFCTSGDQCSGGTCQAGTVEPFTDVALTVIRKSGADDDQLRIKTVQPLATLEVVPSDVGMMLEIRDDAGVPRYTSTMPASAITNVGGKSKVFKFKDKLGLIAQAGSMISVTVKRNANRGVVQVKAKMKGAEVPGLADQPTLSMSLLFGEDPSTGDCLTGAPLQCVARGAKHACES